MLYDADCEVDPISLVQSLLLMSSGAPDDERDPWHWIGVAISVAHTIGLHRNPEAIVVDKKQKLWKRIWWSCLMRDRLVALEMRQPTRIKEQDFNVPMLTLEDFDIRPLDNFPTPQGMQQELAMLCIANASLCLVICPRSRIVPSGLRVKMEMRGQA